MRTFALLSVLMALACANPFAEAPAVYTPPATPEAKVALAVELASGITAAPDDADKLLAQRGMSSDQLEDLLAEIAGDAAMSDAYLDARAKK